MTDFSTVTETWGLPATHEQLAMQYCRYRLAGDMGEGRAILEIGCGSGMGLAYLRQRAARVVGGDYTQALLDEARAHLERAPVARFDAQALPFPDASFDVVLMLEMVYYIPDLDRALAEARRVLKPGGRFLCLEFTPAVAPLLQPLYDLYSFQVLPLLGQIVTGHPEAYEYLVESIRRFPPQGALCELIAAAGLARASYRNLTGGVAALHSAWRL